MIKKITSRENMAKAYLHVMRNDGAIGVDGMELFQFKPYLHSTWKRTKAEVEEGNYLPKAIKGVEIQSPMVKLDCSAYQITGLMPL